MNAGDLRERVTIQYNNKAADGSAGYTDTWTDLTTTWMERIFGKGQKVLDANQITSQTPITFKARWRADLTTGGSDTMVRRYRLKLDDDRVLNVHSVRPDRTDFMMEIVASLKES